MHSIDYNPLRYRGLRGEDLRRRIEGVHDGTSGKQGGNETGETEVKFGPFDFRTGPDRSWRKQGRDLAGFARCEPPDQNRDLRT